jgi:hypothetical protein
LNRANGSLAYVDAVIVQADTFLSRINYSDPGVNYTLMASQRSLVISLKTKLDKYINHISCP